MPPFLAASYRLPGSGTVFKKRTQLSDCEENMEKLTEKLSEERQGRCDNPDQPHLKQLHHTSLCMQRHVMIAVQTCSPWTSTLNSCR